VLPSESVDNSKGGFVGAQGYSSLTHRGASQPGSNNFFQQFIAASNSSRGNSHNKGTGNLTSVTQLDMSNDGVAAAIAAAAADTMPNTTRRQSEKVAKLNSLVANSRASIERLLLGQSQNEQVEDLIKKQQLTQFITGASFEQPSARNNPETDRTIHNRTTKNV